MTELVERLRNYIPGENDADVPQRIADAADEIDSLRAQLASARKALQAILEANDDFRKGMPDEWEGDPLQDACNNARAALKDLP